MKLAELPTQDTTRSLPQGWRWAKLGDLAKYVNGRAFKPTEWQGTGLPIIRIQNLTSSAALFNYYAGPVDDCRKVSDGDLLISWSASLDAYLWNRGPALLNQHIFKVLVDEQLVTKEFLFFAVREAMDEIRAQVHGATMRHITKPEFEATRIPLAPLTEQKRIAATLKEQLAAVEVARHGAETQLQAVEALSVAYLRAVFTSLEVQQWPRKRIGEISETSSGSTPSRARADYFGGSIPWVKTGELRDGVIEATEEHVTEKALDECSLPLLPPKTLLIAMYGQGKTRGRTGLLAREMTTNQACFAILPNPEVFDVEYLQWWFRHNYTRLRQETEGRGGNQPNLNGIFLRAQQVKLPPLTDQRRIAAQLSEQIASTERLRMTLAEQLEAINRITAALLRRAFSGGL